MYCSQFGRLWSPQWRYQKNQRLAIVTFGFVGDSLLYTQVADVGKDTHESHFYESSNPIQLYHVGGEVLTCEFWGKEIHQYLDHRLPFNQAIIFLTPNHMTQCCIALSFIKVHILNIFIWIICLLFLSSIHGLSSCSFACFSFL